MTQSTLRPLNDNNAAEDAATWLLRRDDGVDVERDPAFVAWRDADPQNAAAWAHAVSIWAATTRQDADDPLISALRRDALQARPSRLPLPAIGAAAAAAITLLVMVFAWPQVSPWTTPPATQPGPSADAPATFANNAERPNTYALADGSRVTLKGHSAIAVAFDDRRRAVRLLRGQAFFSVSHDAARPFTVAAGARTITDLGTEFDVEVGAESLTVTLVSGAVSVSPQRGRQPISLTTPGQRLTAAAGKADAVEQVELDQALSWRAAMLEFSGRPLAEAVAEINRYGGAPARLVDPTVASLPVTGQFRAGDPTRFANTLAAVFPISVRARSDGGADIAAR